MIDFSSIKGKTLWDRLQYFAETQPDKEAIIHWVAGEEPFRWTYGKLFEAANKFSIYFKKVGVKPGDVCAVIIRHNPYFYPLYLGISGAGALPAILAYPNPRLHPEKFRQGLAGMSQRSGLDWIFTEKDLEEIIRPFVETKESTVDDLYFPFEWNYEGEILQAEQEELDNLRSQVTENVPMLLQHSSGTTGLQKPVVLSHKAILDHVKCYGESLELAEDDIIVSWLPVYHDMGLIGAFINPLASGITTIQIDPFEWVIAPILLFEAASKEKATLTWLPNFAYNLLADKLPDDEMEGLSLDSFRMIINASEPIRSESQEKFYNRFSNYGLKKNVLSTLYGMAEVTLAFSQSKPGTIVKEVTVDRQKLSNGSVELADENAVKRVCVSSGKVIGGCELKIVDESRKEVNNDSVGEIVVKSISMFDGYRNYPEKTAEVIDDEGWCYSGDIGFVYEDELYVIGRKKDIIIVAGKNIYPEDVEDAINKLKGVIPGRLIAFGEDDLELGTEQVSLVAETKLEKEEDLKALRMDILRAGMAIDVNIHGVYLVPPRWLIKSSSGKPSRKANKERIINKSDDKIWSA